MKVATIILIAVFALMPSFALANKRFVQVVDRNNVDVVLKRVEFDSRYFSGLDGYYKVGEQIREDKQYAQQQDNLRLQGQVELLLRILAAREGIDLKAQPLPKPQPQPEPTPQPAPQPDENGGLEATNLDIAVYNIFKESCVKCHGSNPANNGLTLIDNGALQLLELPERAEVFDRVYGVNLEERGKTRMPKGKVLPDDQVETLRLWMMEESDRIRSLK